MDINEFWKSAISEFFSFRIFSSISTADSVLAVLKSGSDMDGALLFSETLVGSSVVEGKVGEAWFAETFAKHSKATKLSAKVSVIDRQRFIIVSSLRIFLEDNTSKSLLGKLCITPAPSLRRASS